jgi:hypothetical protein
LDAEPVDRCGLGLGAIPARLDAHRRRDDCEDRCALPTALGHALQVSEDDLMLGVRRVPQRLDGLVVEHDGSHAEMARCASAHSSTSSASARGWRASTSAAGTLDQVRSMRERRPILGRQSQRNLKATTRILESFYEHAASDGARTFIVDFDMLSSRAAS